ncbi:MAG: hypothetical protein IJC72_02240, partial [Clostridia bacterium]|nr:hypothetical protein [Clostridia bacterium]
GEGIAVIADVTKEGVKFDYVPYNKTDVGLTYDETGEILKGLKERSEEIKQPGFIEETFGEDAEKLVKDRYVTHMIKKYPVDDTDLNLSLFHYAECDVHHEGLVTGLRRYFKLGKYGEFKKD